MSRELISTILGRRSIRNFLPDPIPDNDLTEILNAGFAAPSAGNCQPWRVVVVKDASCQKQLASCAGGQTFMAQAPVILVVCAVAEESARRYGSRGEELYVLQDTAALTTTILLAAHALGYGSCWIGAFNEAGVAKTLRIPKNMRPVAMIPIGRLDGGPPARRSRRPHSEVVVQDRF
ncbi:nitroreductase family protein [Candidatus Thorarchaeota archaeon]|nr:MAG: nitroreductase family protein [Candidatus Thorarchaeota archaeon]